MQVPGSSEKPKGPKSGPRGPKIAPKIPQDTSRTPPRCPKKTQDWIQVSPENEQTKFRAAWKSLGADSGQLGKAEGGQEWPRGPKIAPK